VEDKHGSSDGPTEKDFAVAADALVGKDAVSAFLDPLGDIRTAAGPEETHANAEERFVNTKVAANGTAMEEVKEQAAERGGHDNEEQ
jgi:hypothetical protein